LFPLVSALPYVQYFMKLLDCVTLFFHAYVYLLSTCISLNVTFLYCNSTVDCGNDRTLPTPNLELPLREL